MKRSLLNFGLSLVMAITCAIIAPSVCQAAWWESTDSSSPSKDQDQTTSQAPMKTTTAGDYGAVSAFGEIGYKNFRGSGTYGVYFTPCQRFKVSGEYLVQRLNYHFEGGHKRKWVSQYAVGGEYQFLLNCSVFQSIDLGAAYSHAFSHKLNKGPGGIKRRIAGSDGALSFLGTTVRLWHCAFLSADVNYDWVRFHRKYESKKLANGFGGSVGFTQQFARDFALNLGAEFRQPFNAYEASLNWTRLFDSWGLSLGVFGNVTDGKEKVRDIATGGVQLGISFGGKGSKCCRSVNTDSPPCYDRAYCNVLQWVSTPAVYVPVVLAIADQQSTPTCSSIITSTTIPDQVVGIDPACSSTNSITIPLASFFSSPSPLTYTFTVSGTLTPGNTLSIDSQTGVLTATNLSASFLNNTVSVTVTAASSCASASQTFNVRFCAQPS